MKSNRTRLLFPLILMALTLSLSACAGQSALGAGAVESTNPANTTAPTPSLEPGSEEPVSTEMAIDQIPDDDANDNQYASRPQGWSAESHGKTADPDYEVVFAQDEVQRLDIIISPENWQAMLDDMTGLYGEFGASPRGPAANQGGPGQRQPGFEPPAGERPAGMQPPEGQRPPGGNQPGGGGQMEGDEHNPIWVPVTVEFEDRTWEYVGLRFKGNSSLFSSWGSGNYKLPFKLDFDEFEDDYPQINDQRFYGFKQLSLSSNFSDDSLLREKVAADLFREAGVPTAQTTFYQVYVDYGEGPVYFGLYTMVEVVDDTVIKTQFETGSGNVYKPSGQGATFAAGSFSEASFDKETNQDEADYSDILALFEALHAGTRTSDPAAWRAGLEAVFDVDGFLNYLAVNQVIQNWDTYGNIGHNYYLYHDPDTDLLTWIPWDNNMSLGGGGVRPALSISLEEVNQQWPLIRYLLDDPVYQAKYVGYIETFIADVFVPAELSARYQALHDLIQPYATGAQGEIKGHTHLRSAQDFEQALTDLISHARSRYQAAQEYLASMR